MKVIKNEEKKFFRFSIKPFARLFRRMLGLVMGGLILRVNVMAQSDNQSPNIIIILADDLGYGDIGGYYGGRAKTPNLDRLAMEGMIFTDFHSNGPMCSPTRAALLTGRYQQRLGIERPVIHGLDTDRNEDEITIADYMGDAGYATGIIGKWHLGRGEEGNPIHFGFDKFIGCFGGDLDYFSKRERYNGDLDWWDNENSFYEHGYVTDLISEHSSQFITHHKDEPFFLYVAHLAVHFPWQGPEDGDLWAREGGTAYTSNNPGPASKLGPNDPDDVPDVVTRMVESLDESVGGIMATLREHGLEKNTLIFFTSDNGNYLRYSGSTWPEVGSNGPLRGQKTDLYEGGHRVPAIAWWPGKIPPLSVCDETALTFDLLPTFLDILDVPLPPDDTRNSIDGVSLKPMLFENKPLESRHVFWRFDNNKVARTGDWKLLVRGGNTALYNLREDIGETNNLASDYPDKVNQLATELGLWENDVDQ